MCPVSAANAAMVVASVTTGGMAALPVNKVLLKNVANILRHLRFSTSSKSKHKISHAGREQL